MTVFRVLQTLSSPVSILKVRLFCRVDHSSNKVFAIDKMLLYFPAKIQLKHLVLFLRREVEKALKRIMFAILTVLFFFLALIAACIMIFAPQPPEPMESISAPYHDVDYSNLPPVSFYYSRKGDALAYRIYPVASAKKIAVLIHGSSAGSRSMHALAVHLNNQEIEVYAPDVRGHGASGRKGDIDYLGQLEDDLEDLLSQLPRNEKSLTLIGFSSGGAFALRFAASDRGDLFEQYIALAPYIRYDAPTTRTHEKNWAHPAVPRMMALTLLGAPGRKCLGHLPVIAFGVSATSDEDLTPVYSYRLWKNFGLHHHYQADLKAIRKPVAVIVGEKDELLYPQKYLKMFAEAQPHAQIEIVTGVGHTALTTADSALEAIGNSVF